MTGEPLETVQTERLDALGIIKMVRPERFNALDPLMARDLRKAALRMARDESIRCVILAGTERAFCSGADLKYIRAGGQSDDFKYLRPETYDVEAGYGTGFKEILEYLHSTISEIRRAPKPFIAAVKGIAAAGGFGLAMCCDLVFASDQASFEWAYPKTGLTGAESSTFLLPRLVGIRKAFELVFLNPRLSAKQALDFGLITAVIPAADFDAAVIEHGTRLAAGPTRALGIAKRLINEAAGFDRLDAHLDRELRNLVDIAGGRDFSAGIEAFFARQSPEFTGDS